MPTKRLSIPLLVVGAVVLAAALAFRFGAFDRAGGTESQGGLLPAADAERLLVTVKPITSMAGLIGLDQALAAGAKEWDVEPSEPDAFLQLVSDPDTFVDGKAVTDLPVWIIRYSGLTLPAPRPHSLPSVEPGFEYHFMYQFIDARTGVELFAKWTR